ncbi:MAG: hypothetical protein NZ561_12435 [Phycisphaerae bacterium]|nr:hypothetical protein [Phycisphaerae bacterium]MDW8261233.1 hypothetical protein [Phycisphaerales bacterium]
MSASDATTTGSRREVDIVARAGTYYRVTRYIISAVLVAYGIWSYYDGFIKYPEVNRQIAEWTSKRDSAAPESPEYKEAVAKIMDLGPPKGEISYILPNKIFGILLPPLGIAMLLFALYNSRGEIRLTPDDVLHAPGHPPVPLDNLTELDREVWDKKGIAWVKYQLADGKTGEIRLDDFVYERKPIDQIYAEALKRFTPDDEKQGSTTEGPPAEGSPRESA